MVGKIIHGDCRALRSWLPSLRTTKLVSLPAHNLKKRETPKMTSHFNCRRGDPVERCGQRGDRVEGCDQRGNPVEEQGSALAEACGQPGDLVGGCAEECTSVFARYLIPAFIEP